MSGNVKKVWVETTVDYSYVSLKCWDVKHAECGEFEAHDRKVLKSLEVRDSSSESALAVQTHLKHVREFAQGNTRGFPRSIASVRTEVCAEVDNGRKALWVIPVNDKECQPLTEGNIIPEEATVAALFRGAELTVAVLGPVGAETVTPKQGTPATKPVKSGTQATPGSLPNKAPLLEPMCGPGRKC